MKVKDLKDYLAQYSDDLELCLDKNEWEDYENNVGQLFAYYAPRLKKDGSSTTGMLIINN